MVERVSRSPELGRYGPWDTLRPKKFSLQAAPLEFGRSGKHLLSQENGKANSFDARAHWAAVVRQIALSISLLPCGNFTASVETSRWKTFPRFWRSEIFLYDAEAVRFLGAWVADVESFISAGLKKIIYPHKCDTEGRSGVLYKEVGGILCSRSRIEKAGIRVMTWFSSTRIGARTCNSWGVNCGSGCVAVRAYSVRWSAPRFWSVITASFVMSVKSFYDGVRNLNHRTWLHTWPKEVWACKCSQ